MWDLGPYLVSIYNDTTSFSVSWSSISRCEIWKIGGFFTLTWSYLDLHSNVLFSELDENSIAAQAFVFFAAGYETSSNTIAFCLHELALNEEIQEKTRQDINDCITKRDGKLTYDAVQDMKYLDLVILGEFISFVRT